jgi:hypothetical protein
VTFAREPELRPDGRDTVDPGRFMTVLGDNLRGALDPKMQ